MSKTHLKLQTTLIEYDKKESRKKSYNRFAMGIYLQALHQVDEMLFNGTGLRVALLECFNGRLLDKLLKSVDLQTASLNEHRGIIK